MNFEILDLREEPSALAWAIDSSRGGGVTLALAKYSSHATGKDEGIAVAEAFASSLFGTDPSLEHLRNLKDDQVIPNTVSWLAHGLNFGESLMPEDLAADYVRKFLSFFEAPACFTNREGVGHGSISIQMTTSFLDAALIVVDHGRAGLLCVQEKSKTRYESPDGWTKIS